MEGMCGNGRARAQIHPEIPVEVSVHPTMPRQEMDPEFRKGLRRTQTLELQLNNAAQPSASQGGLPGLTSVTVWGGWAINPAPNCVVPGRGVGGQQRLNCNLMACKITCD